MKARLAVFIAILLVTVAGGMILSAWRARPKLIEVSPPAGADHVGTTQSIRLSFSRPMDHPSVESRLVITPATNGAFHWENNSLVFTPNQPWPARQSIQVQLEEGAKASSWLAFNMGKDHWSFTLSQATLAFLWPAAGSSSIYTLDPESGSIHQYTQGINVLDYSASRDGGTLYFSASNTQSGADLYQVDRLQMDSSPQAAYQPAKLLECGASQCRNPVASPDGKTLAYEYLLAKPTGGPSQVQVWILSMPELTAAPAGQADHETLQPTWSSTGWLAYYDRTSSGYEVLNLATQARIQLPNQTGQPGAWSPDGAYYLAPEISYRETSASSETGSSHLNRYHIQDKTALDISGEGSVEDAEAAYAVDGKSIAFARKFLDTAHWTPGRQIWIMGADGSGPHPITNEADYNHYDLAWSRDGSRLAYARFNQESIADPPELWMVNVDGGNPLQLVIGGYSPVWIP
jgi:Tol biopolymer transport system component